jgi:hypothetical protein
MAIIFLNIINQLICVIVKCSVLFEVRSVLFNIIKTSAVNVSSELAFVGPRHFSSLGPFGDSKSIVATAVYSRLSGLMEGMHG